jgi:hypothetical protein
MKLFENWRALFKTPGPTRSATITMLVMWALAAIWGWFFVEPTVLRDSQSAREFVDFATKVFPWLNNVRKLGYEAEKALFLHCVYFFALAPVTVVCNLILVSRPEAAKLVETDTPFQMLAEICFCFGFSWLLIWVMYDYIFQPSYGRLHRTGYSFAVSPFMVPVVAPFFIVGFWCALSCGFYCAYFSVRKLASKE